MKYVIGDNLFAVIFNEAISHDKVRCGMRITSAGFCSIDHSGEDRCFEEDVIVKVWGKSVSLGLESLPDDAEIIKQTLSFRGF